MDHRAVADGAEFADGGLVVEHAVILNVCALSNPDRAVVAPEHRAVPDIHVLFQANVAADHHTRGQKRPFGPWFVHFRTSYRTTPLMNTGRSTASSLRL